MRASRSRSALPPIVLMNALWSAFAFATVLFKPHRATSALLMTGINHFVFASVMILLSGMGLGEMLGVTEFEDRKVKSS